MENYLQQLDNLNQLVEAQQAHHYMVTHPSILRAFSGRWAITTRC